MTTILIVCGAGASSTFLASRMRALATARGVEVTIQASSDDDLGSHLSAVDLLLIGAHLKKDYPDLQALAAAHSVAIGLLPDTVFTAGGAEQAFDLATSLAPRGRLTSTNRTKDTTHG
ncbi:MAG: hypothetical protein JWM51_1000 [Microbacteriaceae bacterium]|jgi:PTS system cellobiose-specific IIB component|nr:hypothetical protein [Microbacteriaceae bacterium]